MGSKDCHRKTQLPQKHFEKELPGEAGAGRGAIGIICKWIYIFHEVMKAASAVFGISQSKWK